MAASTFRPASASTMPPIACGSTAGSPQHQRRCAAVRLRRLDQQCEAAIWHETGCAANPLVCHLTTDKHPSVSAPAVCRSPCSILFAAHAEVGRQPAAAPPQVNCDIDALALCPSYRLVPANSSSGSLAPQITPSSPPMKAATPSGACSQKHPGYSCEGVTNAHHGLAAAWQP